MTFSHLLNMLIKKFIEKLYTGSQTEKINETPTGRRPHSPLPVTDGNDKSSYKS